LLLVDTSQGGKTWSISKELCERVLAKNIGISYETEDKKYAECRLSPEQIRQVIDTEAEGIEDKLAGAKDCLFVKDLTGKGINPFEEPEKAEEELRKRSERKTLLASMGIGSGYDSHGNPRSSGYSSNTYGGRH
jgi:hypothetical protein